MQAGANQRVWVGSANGVALQGSDLFSPHPYSGLTPRALRCHRFAVGKTALSLTS